MFWCPIQRETFLSIEQSAISLNCKPIMPPTEKKYLYQDSLKLNIIRDCFLRSEKSMYCLKHDPS